MGGWDEGLLRPSCTGAGRDAVLGSNTPGAEPLVLPRPVRRTPRRLVVRAT